MNLPEMKPVVSSQIKSIGHDTNTDTLYIRFSSNTIYQYKDVPHNVYIEMLNSPSVGKFLNDKIKGIYPYKKLE